jgi:hypothetical protein
MSRIQVFKAIAKKATTKVLAGLQPSGSNRGSQYPDTPEGAATFVAQQKKSVKALVDGYLQKHTSGTLGF